MLAEKEKLSVTKQEYRALSDISGLATDAHYMVMCAQMTKSGGWILEGTTKSFDDLIADLSEEICEGLSPPSRIKHLVKLYERLSPDCEF